MKTYPLIMEDALHMAIKHTADSKGESIKEFILKSIKARLNIEDYIKSNNDLQEDLKNWKNINFNEIKSISELFIWKFYATLGLITK